MACRRLGRLGWVVVALVGCGDDAVAPEGGASSTSAETGTSQTTGSATTGSATTMSTPPGTSSTSGSSEGGRTTSDTETDPTTGGLALCIPEDFSSALSGTLRDNRCTEGSRCFVTAVCTAVAETPSAFGGWSYELSCDGDWTVIADAGDQTEARVGAEVLLYSLYRLDLGGDPMDYRVDSDFADRFGGIDTTRSQLRRGDELVAASASGAGGFGVEGFSFFTGEETACDSSSLTLGFDECVFQKGLSGVGPDRTSIEVLAGDALMGDQLQYVGSAHGYELCDPLAYRRSARGAVVSTAVLVEPYRR